MFETKENVRVLHKLVWEQFGSQDRGFAFTTKDIETAIGVSRDDQSFEWVRRKFIRLMLKERGIQVDWEHGSQCHRLLTHKEQATYGSDRIFRKAMRRVEHMRRVLMGVDSAQLSNADRQLLMVKKDNTRAVKRRMLQARNQVGMIRKTEVNPIRKVRTAATVN